MKRLIIVSLLATSAFGQDLPRWNTWEKAWVASAASFGGATVLDIASSYGNVGRERNPVFGDTFTAKDAALKAGVAAGIITAQYLVIRRWPGSLAAQVFAIINGVETGITTGVAVRNLRIAK